MLRSFAGLVSPSCCLRYPAPRTSNGPPHPGQGSCRFGWLYELESICEATATERFRPVVCGLNMNGNPKRSRRNARLWPQSQWGRGAIAAETLILLELLNRNRLQWGRGAIAAETAWTGVDWGTDIGLQWGRGAIAAETAAERIK